VCGEGLSSGFVGEWGFLTVKARDTDSIVDRIVWARDVAAEDGLSWNSIE
jgi:hypothetical protein